ILQLTYEENPDMSLNKEVVVQKEYAEIMYRLTLRDLKSKRGLYMGKMYVFQDITKQKLMYNALENMSSYDPLTGFYTSRVFENKLEEWDKNAEEYIVAICNIAGMKLINAFYERKTGSSIIQRMSEELRDVLPEESLVCYADDDCTVIVAKGITENQMNLYLSNAARKLKKRGLNNIPIFLNYGIARRENTSVSINEYIKYAAMDMLIKKGRDGASQKREMTEALTKEYFHNEYESLEHVNRIQVLARALAEKLSLSEEDMKKLDLLCFYHDIGRVKTREEVWSRAAVITRDELDVIKLHSITGYQIVKEMQLEYDISELVLYHHENFDGSGYPYGLKGEAIPVLDRILAIVDSYDVMINDQLYKGAVSEEAALEELRNNAGIQFDPALVKKFEECLKERK
ncbi:MAG: HD domain-containing protein, partial [Lachnospiraceae bacterium]|nr:HD domain-containing protein [Lachnospiraceae bacterium]